MYISCYASLECVSKSVIKVIRYMNCPYKSFLGSAADGAVFVNAGEEAGVPGSCTGYKQRKEETGCRRKL
jgi:hypothetical protein